MTITTSSIVGIDLATVPKKTGVVVIDRRGDRLAASVPAVKGDDASLVGLAAVARVVAVDSPLGWPSAFVDSLVRHRAQQPWEEPNGNAHRWRATDQFIKDELGQVPLSVSTDRLGATALRCARLQSMWSEAWGEPIDRTGAGRLVEVYPAATLVACGLPRQGYKTSSDVRRSLIAELQDRTNSWLDLDDVVDSCVASDHVTDGLISALTAVLVTSGATVGPDTASLKASRSEGWIHAPAAGFDLSAFVPR